MLLPPFIYHCCSQIHPSTLNKGLKLPLLICIFQLTLILIAFPALSQKIDLRLTGTLDCADSTFCTNIQIKSQNSNTAKLGSSSIRLTYDTQVLNYLSYSSLNFDENTVCGDEGNPSIWFPQNVDNSQHGILKIALTLNPDSSGFSCPEITSQNWVDIGKICFKVLNMHGNPNIQFDTSTTPAQHSVTFFNSYHPNDGTNALTTGTLSGVNGSIFECALSSISGSIDFQGRNQDTGKVSVKFYNSNDLSQKYSFQTHSNGLGVFSINNIEPGLYDICIKHPKSLQRVQRIHITSGNNNLYFPELRMGDATDDNLINILDFAVLLTTYNKNNSQQGYIDAADFNGDKSVSILDFSILISNYNQSGETPEEGPLRVSFSPEKDISKTGSIYAVVYPPTGPNSDTIKVSLFAETDKQALDGVSTFLSFNPQVLSLIDLHLSDDPDIILLNEYDNDKGNIDISVGFMEKPAQGNFKLAELSFKKTGVSRPDFQFDTLGYRQTDLTFNGVSILRTTSIENYKLLDNPLTSTGTSYLYPNPSSKSFKLIPGDISLPCSINIYDVQGRNISSHKLIETSEINFLEILIPQAGIYQCVISDNHTFYNQTIIKR